MLLVVGAISPVPLFLCQLVKRPFQRGHRWHVWRRGTDCALGHDLAASVVGGVPHAPVRTATSLASMLIRIVRVGHDDRVRW